MNPTTLPLSKQNVFLAISAAIVVPGILFLFSWHIGFDLADEGYFWYGAQRVLHGELPIRDYMSYDIGRYYWAAAVMQALADSGIHATRVSALLFQCLTISVALFLCLWAMPSTQSLTKRLLFALTAALTLTLWMTPYYKAFDHGSSILMVAMLVLLLKSINYKTWLSAGLLLGAMAMFGRNHGVYGAVAAFFTLVWLLLHGAGIRETARPAAGFIFGVLLSFSPTFLLMAWAPGFTEAFIESIRALIKAGETNIALPVPWPWHFDPRMLGWLTWALEFLRGSMFVSLLLLPALIVLYLSRRRMTQLSPAQLLLLATAFAGIPYSHYAYSRADLTHLALAIFPLLIALMTIGSMLNRPLLKSTGLLLISIWALSDFQPVLDRYLKKQQYEPVQISGHTVFTLPGTAKRIARANAALERHPEAQQSFLALPDMPSLHAMYQAKMATWEIYSLFARDAAFEQEELKRLGSQPPKMILISNHALDQREEFRYSQFHPMIYAWIKENYSQASGDDVQAESKVAELEIYLLNEPSRTR